MIQQFLGTVGSGKSYHALEVIVDWLAKGKYVIANFPLNFSEGQIRRGYADRYMYIPDELMQGSAGVSRLIRISLEHFYHNKKESQCLLVIDEAGGYFPPEENSRPEQRLWKKFFTLSRKLGYDIILVHQEDKQINRTIRGCIEYMVLHRKANNVKPWKWLPWTIFFYITYWKQARTRLGSDSSIYVPRFAEMYDTFMLFNNIEDDLDIDYDQSVGLDLTFGNCLLVNEEKDISEEKAG